MSIQFYNSLSRKKEKFIPLKDGEISMYTCGPTVYDLAHIGNFRTFLFEDLLKRFFLLHGFKVTHVMNITDVDDKTIAKVMEKGTTLAEVTEEYSRYFFHDLEQLKIIPADEYPRATAHIKPMLKMIGVLIDKKYAYQTEDGSVFFAINRYADYGKLANIKVSSMRQTTRVESDEYGSDNPQDFALWKAWKEEDGDIFWESPWGKGRPGWHIECSAMSTQYLGEHFDIHCGGVDNMFPHHENEIAQSVCSTGEDFVNYWLHSEHIMVDGGKMSKSLNNFYRISELLEEGMTSETIRYILLSPHYRTKVNFSIGKNHEAAKAIQRIFELNNRLESLDPGGIGGVNYPDEYTEFLDALDDDLDTPQALGIFFDWVRKMNLALDTSSINNREVSQGLKFIAAMDSVFGILPAEREIPEEVQKLVQKRENARANKDWARADEIRNILSKMGWTLKDTSAGTKCIKIF